MAHCAERQRFYSPQLLGHAQWRWWSSRTKDGSCKSAGVLCHSGTWAIRHTCRAVGTGKDASIASGRQSPSSSSVTRARPKADDEASTAQSAIINIFHISIPYSRHIPLGDQSPHSPRHTTAQQGITLQNTAYTYLSDRDVHRPRAGPIWTTTRLLPVIAW